MLQRSELMAEINEHRISWDRKECCLQSLESLRLNCEKVSLETKDNFSQWNAERKYRFTGTTCYGLYTYLKNKKPKWDEKIANHISPKNFKSVYTEYGKKNESKARQVFINCTQKTVIQVGLIISKQNPWLAVSPDGVVFHDGKPNAVLEIKCPFVGKDKGIDETVSASCRTFLTKEGENIILKRKHTYFTQTQIAMAVCNVKNCYFVIYSQHDNKIYQITVKRDDSFLISMLKDLKKLYFERMIHKVCQKA